MMVKKLFFISAFLFASVLLQAQTRYIIAGTSAANTYTATVPTSSSGISNYFYDKQPVFVFFQAANTGAATININGTGAKPIKKYVSTTLASGDIKALSIHTLFYDGTNFQITSGLAGAESVGTVTSVGLVAGSGVSITGSASPITTSGTFTISSTPELSGLTTNYLPVATSSSTLGNSLLYQDGGIQLSTIAPSGMYSRYGFLAGQAMLVSGQMGFFTTANSNQLYLKAGATGSDITYLLPGTLPTAGQVLSTSAPSAQVSTMSWIDPTFATSSNLSTVLSNGRNVDATGTILTSAGDPAISVNSWTLKDPSNFASLVWSSRSLYDASFVLSANWNGRTLRNSSAATTLDWNSRLLYGGQWDYNADYSGSYTSRSVVDKAYVDGLVSGGYVPTSRTLTINGSAQDLSANRTWAITTTGTSNRISVTGGAGLTPTVDISSSYVGQASITTLGTIGTGTWNGTAIGLQYGGTGQNFSASKGLININAGLSAEVVTPNTSGTRKYLGQSGTLGVEGTPTYSQIDAATDLTGITPIANGGTSGATALAGFNALSPLTTRGDLLTRDATNNIRLAKGATGKFLTTDANDVVWSTSTIPTSAGATANKVLLSDGTNYVLSTPTFPNASATSGKTIRSDGTNWIASTATLSDAPSTANKWLRSDGTNWITSTSTLSDAPSTSGKFLRSDGTNWITSTLILPNSATANGITYATATNTLGESSLLNFNGSTLMLNTNAARTTSGVVPTFQTEGTGYNTSAFGATANVNDALTSPIFFFTKTRATVINGVTITADGDRMGAFFFCGADGVTGRQGAGLEAYVDGTPSAANGVPGSLVFSTTPGGGVGASLVERVRLKPGGNLLVGYTAVTNGELFGIAKSQNSGTAALINNVNGGTGAYSGLVISNTASASTGLFLGTLGTAFTSSGIFTQNANCIVSSTTGGLDLGTNVSSATRFWTNNTEKMRINSTGEVGIGMTAVNILDITKNQNAASTITLLNSNGGTAAYAASLFSNGTSTNQFGTLGTAYSTNGVLVANRGFIYSGSDAFAIDAGAATGFIVFGTGGTTERARITAVGNVKIAGTATRATTEGTNHLDIFDGTAPVGTLANGVSLYSTAGELRVMDAAGNATLLSPHDSVTNDWIYYCVSTQSGKVLRIDMEQMMKKLNDTFGWDFVHEYTQQEMGGTQVISPTPSPIINITTDPSAPKVLVKWNIASAEVVNILSVPKDGVQLTLVVSNTSGGNYGTTFGALLVSSGNLSVGNGKKCTIKFIGSGGVYVEQSRSTGLQ